MKTLKRRTLARLGLAAGAAALLGAGQAAAQDMPAPFDTPEDVTIALVRYLSTGDFFQAYLSGVERQAEALGVELRVFDSRQDAALQADMVDQAIGWASTASSPTTPTACARSSSRAASRPPRRCASQRA